MKQCFCNNVFPLWMLGGLHSGMKTCFCNNVILFIMEKIVDGSNLDNLT